LDALQECLQRLAPESRRVIEDHYFKDHTIAAIAQRQGRKGGTVRMMLLRIRQALGKCVRDKLGEAR
jgi:DNA-directed RNA polymerase specialized sigma24 family protein